MHGSISLKSKLDQGTVATFTIPFKKPEYTAGGVPLLIDVSALPDRLQSEMSLSCNNSSRASTSRERNDSPAPPSPTGIVAASFKAHHGSLPPGNMTTTAMATALSDAQRKQFHVLVVEGMR